MGTGHDKVNGGEGIDTVVYEDVTYTDNTSISLRRAGNTVSYNNTDSLTEIEYIQFADVRIDAETLEIFPTLEVNDVNVIEGSSASFSFELDSPAPTDVTFNYSTEDINAVSGLDYTTMSGQVTIPTGETAATVEIEVLEDNLYDENSESFALNITGLTGATFAENATESRASAFIENKGRDEPMNLTGGGESDLIEGGTGNDSLVGNNGDDTLKGDDGDDTLRGNAGHDLLNGDVGDDSLYGADGNDTMDGGDGIDRILEYGNVDYTLTDTSLTGRGTDTLSQIELARLQGGTGDNRLDASRATTINVTLDGREGNDTLIGGGKSDGLLGRDGNDRLLGKKGDDTLYGANGNDTLYGDTGNDHLNGHGGDDSLYGADGNDTMDGGDGIDRILEYGNVDYTLTDTSLTGRGTDTLSQIELARLQGGTGDNRLDASGATTINVTLDGAEGNDTLIGGGKSDGLLGRDGDDSLRGNRGNDTLNGNNGNDTLRGHSGNDLLNGGDGDDTIYSSYGNDTVNGGNGIDRLHIVSDNDLTLSNTQVTGDGTDIIEQIEYANLSGQGGNNLIDASSATTIQGVLKGNDGNDTLMGSQMSDYIWGGNDDDTLMGGMGDDTLIGGNGADVIVLESAAGTDLINGFNDGVDSFALSASLGFGDLSILNNSEGTATLIRDTTNNNQLVAIVDNVDAANITAEDFSVI